MLALPAFRSPRNLIESWKLTIPELFEWNAKENPNYPLFRFHDGNKLNALTYAEVFQGAKRAARYVKARIPTPQIVAVVVNVGEA